MVTFTARAPTAVIRPQGRRTRMYLVEQGTASFGAPVRPQPDAVLDRFDRAALSSDHQRKINQLADQIVASWKSNRPALAVETVGHADKQADTGDKTDLGRQRAERVLKTLSDAVWTRDVDVQQRMSWGRRSEGVKRPVSM